MQASELSHVADAQQLPQRFFSMEELCRFLGEELRDCVLSGAQGDAPRDGDTTFSRILRYLGVHFAESVSLKELVKLHFINKTYACALFKEHLGITFTEYLARLRIQKAKEMLAGTSLPVTDIAQQVGIPDGIYFSLLFKRMVGQTPSQYRRQPWAAGEAE